MYQNETYLRLLKQGLSVSVEDMQVYRCMFLDVSIRMIVLLVHLSEQQVFMLAMWHSDVYHVKRTVSVPSLAVIHFLIIQRFIGSQTLPCEKLQTFRTS